MEDAKKAEAIAIAATKKLKDLKYKEALDLFNQAIKESITFCGGNAHFYSRRGECFLKLGFFKEAIEDIEKASKINGAGHFKSQLCSAYFYSGQYELALNSINRFLPETAQDEAYLTGYYLLLMAAVYHKLGDTESMYTCLEKAAKHEIDDMNVLAYEDMYDDVAEDERFIGIFEP